MKIASVPNNLGTSRMFLLQIQVEVFAKIWEREVNFWRIGKPRHSEIQ